MTIMLIIIPFKDDVYHNLKCYHHEKYLEIHILYLVIENILKYMTVPLNGRYPYS
jgi:hypothetical protein